MKMARQVCRAFTLCSMAVPHSRARGFHDAIRRVASRIFSGGRPVIWVLEACDLNPMSIRRAVWTLLQRGWLRTASGFLVGRPLASFRGEMMGVDSYNAVTDLLAGAGVPVIMDCDIGHVPPMMPLVIGSEASVSVKGNDLTVRMNLDT